MFCVSVKVKLTVPLLCVCVHSAWKGCPQNDLYCVRSDVKPYSLAHSHTYEYLLPVNFTCTSSFCAGHVFIQLAEGKLLVNSINIIYKSRGAYLLSELTSA